MMHSARQNTFGLFVIKAQKCCQSVRKLLHVTKSE